jgi:formyltetrahydrofolate deformylase
MPVSVASPPQTFVLTLSCQDRPGLVHAVSTFLVDHGGDIRQSQQFDDRLSGRFFMRVQFVVHEPAQSADGLRSDFCAVGQQWQMDWQITLASTPVRTLVMVSKFDHCLHDLLLRHRLGALNIDVPAIVSNHPDLEPLAATYSVPFHHIPVTQATKQDAEAQLLDLVDELQIDLVVLARYMQILSDDLCKQLEGRAINIHHSFLPGFKGAKPYHQAHDRGVKLIGATAHYVTADLDEGPIVEQDVARVDHALTPEEFVTVGRDVEAQVLARAVKWHSERRVLLNGDRTVVFR